MGVRGARTVEEDGEGAGHLQHVADEAEDPPRLDGGQVRVQHQVARVHRLGGVARGEGGGLALGEGQRHGRVRLQHLPHPNCPLRHQIKSNQINKSNQIKSNQINKSNQQIKSNQINTSNQASNRL
eukprot:1187722-Prorocentrum_minimum.AAC.1